MSEAVSKKKIGLTTKIFIALLLGAAVGALLHAFAASPRCRTFWWAACSMSSGRALSV